MPVRLLREAILDSEAVNSLSLGAEVFYRRLMSVVDDYGRFDGRPTVLRTRLYPLRVETVREPDIIGWADECERAGLIERYAVGGKPYILFLKLGKPRATESKYPAPPARPEVGPVQSADANGRAQTQADANDRARGKTGAPYSYSVSDSTSYSDSTSGPTSVSGAAAGGERPSVGRPDTIPFDPLRADQDARKLFEQRWNAAGLRKFSRLTHGLHGRLAAMLLDDWWASNYPAALERAGRIPFLATGAGRQKGALDVGEFLKDADLVRQIIDGVYDPREVVAQARPGGKPTVDDVIAAEEAKRAKKPGEAA